MMSSQTKTALIGIPTFIIVFTSLMYYNMLEFNVLFVLGSIISCIIGWAFGCAYLETYFDKQHNFAEVEQ